ncbi:MAG: VOC family protein [Chlamydiae bacterium]|nr:VOC family protein [Chlamydiota bacterium]MBI3277614.1 VOC family protein [Chlamydiota bacterium]
MTPQSFPPLLGLRHIALKVKNLKSSEAFYTQVLGFKLEWRPDAHNLYLTSGRDNLALHETVSLGNVSLESPLDHLGLLVKDPEEVDQWSVHLKKMGISLTQEPKTHRDGARSIYFKDPDGNLIQILYHPNIKN